MKKLLFVCVALLMAGVARARIDYPFTVTVAQDGSGNFTTIQEAVLAQKHFAYGKTYVLVKKGIYREKIEIPSWITDLVIVGEDRDSTVIGWGDHTGKINPHGERLMTFTSYTLKVSGNRTKLIDLTIENDSGQRGQGVALHIEADGILVKNCRVLGNQDTIYATGERNEALMVDCYVDGTTDYIFGSAQLFLDNCHLHCKRNSFITAASTPEGRPFGFAIFHTRITAEPDATRMFLGRPWRNYARTVFLACTMGPFIVPEGWQNWGRPEAEATAYYGEYGSKNTDVSKRVAWSHQLTEAEAKPYYDELERMKDKYIE